MNEARNTLTPRLIKKIALVLAAIILIMGASYVLITGYTLRNYHQASLQRLNADIAQHLIDEKFGGESPFLEDGSPNKALFSDIMHDMMAVNRGIEVYLLSKEGEVLYSVVLDHGEGAPIPHVSTTPIEDFIGSDGSQYILGDNPRNPAEKRIFSAAPFTAGDRQGYVYIILAGQRYQEVSQNLLGSYFIKLGLGATLLSMLFAAGIGMLGIWFLTKNLRQMIQAIRRFREGDLQVRIPNPERSDLAVFAGSFNEMADALVGNMEKLQSVDTLRRELIANVSHDLRTPLAVLKGYIETLQMRKDRMSRQEIDEYLSITHDNVDKLSKLIHQLFEYSKLEAEQITPVKEPFSITELSHDLIAKFRVLAEQKGIDLRLENPEANCMVYADLSLVERALQNLIENAIKYTEEGGEVVLSLIPRQQLIEIAIRDTGIGIPHSEQPFIFDRFTRADTTSSRQGSGLGLAIVKKILELHETTITVLSKPREGSSFVFNLPAYG